MYKEMYVEYTACRGMPSVKPAWNGAWKFISVVRWMTPESILNNEIPSH